MLKNVADIYPLTPSQEGMLFHTLADDQPGVYVQQILIDLTGPINASSLEVAWNNVISRHGALRTLFVWEGVDSPVQVVRERVSVPWEVVDETVFDSGESLRFFERWLEEDRHLGFDPASAPLIRFTLFKIDESRSRLVWTFHHLLMDGWSTAQVLEEVFGEYLSVEGLETVAPVMRRPFSEFIEWLGSRDLRTGETFWKRQLEGVTGRTRLALERTSGGKGSNGRFEILLSPDLFSSLKRTARAERITLNTIVQGAWGLVLAHFSGQKDAIHGVTVAGRPPELPGVDHMIGAFINTLPLRVHVLDDRPVNQWLRDIQDRLSDIQQFAWTPLSEIQKWTGLQPLFETVVVFENYPTGTKQGLKPAGIRVDEIRYLEQSNFPLALLIIPEDGLRLLVIHNTARYSEAAVGWLLDSFETVLEAIAGGPLQRVGGLDAVSPPARQRLIREWSGRDAYLDEYESGRDVIDAHRPVHETIFTVAADRSQAPAVTCGNEVLSYGELVHRSRILASRLRTAGLQPGQLVALLAERSTDLVVSILGILEAGGGYVPLDTNTPSDRLALLLADASAAFVVTDQSSRQFPVDDIVVIDVNPSEDAGLGAPTGSREVGLDDPAYLIYTSGSTGTPKGVLVRHRQLSFSTSARSVVYEDRPESFLLLSPHTFDSSVAGIFWTLASGGHLIIPPPGDEREVRSLAESIHRREITHVLCVPSLYSLLIAHALPRKLDTLKTVIVAGEACPLNLIDSHSGVLPQCALYNEYGPTETTVWATVSRLDNREIDDVAAPIGRPIPGVEVYLVDNRTQLVPPGAVGELLIGGGGVTDGYFKRDAQTESRFIANPFSEGSGTRLYRTGDRAFFNSTGELVFVGRTDDQIQVRGRRIEPGEVEAALLSHPGVRECVVSGVEVDGRRRLVAYVIPGVTNPSRIAIRQYLSVRLPAWMVPETIELTSDFPRTRTGKVDRTSLGALLIDSGRDSDSVRAPTNPLESQLVILYKDLLGVDAIGLDDHFFEMGGDSLSAVTLAMRIEDRLGIDTTVSAVLTHPTPGELAGHLINSRHTSGRVSPVAIRSAGEKTPLYCVPGAGGYPVAFHGLASHLGKDQPVFAIEMQGVDGRELPLTSVPDIATQHVEEIVSSRSEADILLCGYSTGGLVAIEMAQQFTDRGINVPLVVLLDTRLHTGIRWTPLETLKRGYLRLSRGVLYHRGLHAARRYLRNGQRMPRELRNSFPGRAHERAAFRFEPPAYRGPVLLLTSNSDAGNRNKVLWEQLLRGRLESVDIGNTHDMLTEPDVRKVASVLKEWMIRIDKDV